MTYKEVKEKINAWCDKELIIIIPPAEANLAIFTNNYTALVISGLITSLMLIAAGL